jgi:hypothetical protein
MIASRWALPAGLLAAFLPIATTMALAVGEKATAALKTASGEDAGVVTLTEGTAGVLLKFELSKAYRPDRTLFTFTKAANVKAISAALAVSTIRWVPSTGFSMTKALWLVTFRISMSAGTEQGSLKFLARF